MKISDVLRSKGSEVASVPPSATVQELLDRLAERGVGAMLVLGDNGDLAGIASERDVVRSLQQSGPGLLDATVDTIMTSDLITCAPGDDLDHIMRLMTDRRIRHLPVVDRGELAGIVSIGDVVKSRIDELVTTTAHLESYISGG